MKSGPGQAEIVYFVLYKLSQVPSEITVTVSEPVINALLWVDPRTRIRLNVTGLFILVMFTNNHVPGAIQEEGVERKTVAGILDLRESLFKCVETGTIGV